jgi:virginiamycin B lyase
MGPRGRFRGYGPSLALAALLALALAFAPRAAAFVYWTNDDGGTIGRANLDGTEVNQSFIGGANSPIGVAVNGTHIYWANFGNASGTTIGRANLDGTEANQSFITTATGPCGPGVDSAHVYWANGATIGRANLDGTGVDTSFVTGAGIPCGVAANSSFIYWANQSSFGTIGRVGLDGTTGKDLNFVPTGSGSLPTGVAVDGAHVYWANNNSPPDTLGRANLNGTGVNLAFITGSQPCGVAVDGAHIYWANFGNDTIGRANLDGTGVDNSFITGANGPCGVAVDALEPPLAQPPLAPSSQKPSNEFSFGKVKKNKRRGTATLPVEVPGSGQIALSGNGVRAASARRAVSIRAPGTVNLLVKAKGKKKRKLNRKGKVKVSSHVTYTPTGGSPNTLSIRISLIKRIGG